MTSSTGLYLLLDHAQVNISPDMHGSSPMVRDAQFDVMVRDGGLFWLFGLASFWGCGVILLCLNFSFDCCGVSIVLLCGYILFVPFVVWSWDARNLRHFWSFCGTLLHIYLRVSDRRPGEITIFPFTYADKHSCSSC